MRLLARLSVAASVAALLCGCVQTMMPQPVASTRLGTTMDVPIGVVTGRSRVVYFFERGPSDEDLTARAVSDARRSGSGDRLENVTISRKRLCFPACGVSLVASVTTTVTGTLVRYKRLDDEPAPPEPKPGKLLPGRQPETKVAVERFKHLYLQDPSGAEQFYDSLSALSRGQIRDFILARGGVNAAYGWQFKLPKSADADELKFIEWYVGRYTTYQPVRD